MRAEEEEKKKGGTLYEKCPSTYNVSLAIYRGDSTTAAAGKVVRRQSHVLLHVYRIEDRKVVENNALDDPVRGGQGQGVGGGEERGRNFKD